MSATVALQSNSAEAAPITGPVGVGTYNTQADADIKVVKGTQTLYASNFSSGTAGWTPSGGTWQTQDGALRQTGSGTPALDSIGDASWSDFTLTLKARKISGSEGFLIAIGAPSSDAKSWWNIGGWNNTKSALQMPGVFAPEVAGKIETGRWYRVRVDVRDNDIRCFLDDALVYDTERLLDDSERDARVQEALSSPGFGRLSPGQQESLRKLLNRPAYLGDAARSMFSAMPSRATFAALSADAQADILRKVNRNRLTWKLGWGFKDIDPKRKATIINSMDRAVMLYNSLGLFDKSITANNSAGTPTADGSYDGNIRFGRAFNSRVALHELGHCMGVGTYGRWWQLMVNHQWTGPEALKQLKEFDGEKAVLHGDHMHFWPYGLNQDREASTENNRRHVLMVAALRRDMGIDTKEP